MSRHVLLDLHTRVNTQVVVCFAYAVLLTQPQALCLLRTDGNKRDTSTESLSLGECMPKCQNQITDFWQKAFAHSLKFHKLDKTKKHPQKKLNYIARSGSLSCQSFQIYLFISSPGLGLFARCLRKRAWICWRISDSVSICVKSKVVSGLLSASPPSTAALFPSGLSLELGWQLSLPSLHCTPCLVGPASLTGFTHVVALGCPLPSLVLPRLLACDECKKFLLAISTSSASCSPEPF